MLKKILFLVAAAFSVSSAQAQNIGFGIKGGANFSNVGGNGKDNLLQDESGDFEVKTKGMAGLHLGVFANFGITDIISIQPEMVYSTKGFEVDDSFEEGGVDLELTGSQKLNYIDVPVLINIKAGNLFFEAGPQFSILVDADTDLKAKVSYTDPFTGDRVTETVKPENYEKDGFKTLDAGYAFGLGYNFGNGLILSARYSGGFSTIFDKEHNFTEDELYEYAYYGGDDEKDRPEIKTGTFQLSIGYLITGR